MKMLTYISKIQLVVYYQCYVLIGWATTSLNHGPLVAKSAGFENQNNGGWLKFCYLKLFCLDILTN